MAPELIQAIELFITATAAVIAVVRHRQKLHAERSAAEAGAASARAEDRAVRALAATAQAQDRAADVVSFFDPADERVTGAPAGIPVRSYTMADDTKRWLTFDHSAGERLALLGQVEEAEKKGLATYTIEVPTAWYAIEYGLVRSAGRIVPEAKQ